MVDAAALYALGRFGEAAAAFADRCAAQPSDADAWAGRGQSLLAAGRPAEAWDSLTRALALVRAKQAIATIELLRGAAAGATGRIDHAEACFRAANAARDSSRGRALFGTFLLNQSRLEEAETELRAAARAGGANDAQVVASLASVRTQSGRAEEALEGLARWRGAPNPPVALAWARALLALRRPAEALAPLDAALLVAAPAQTAQLHHARALVLDQLDDVPAAAAAFAAMHVARGVQVAPEAILAMADAVIAAYPVASPFPAAPAASGPQPLFIVGLPRSGTSLCEQALAAHPLVLAAGERDELRRLTLRFGEALGEPWPGCAARVHRGAVQAASMWRTAVAGASTAAVVTDKLPDNLFRLGLAAQLFPDGRAILMRRDPMDTLLSCWQQGFGPVHAWTSTWAGLAAMAVASERVAQRWLAEAPMPILAIRYEDYVAQPEREMRRILSFCGLEWDAGVLAPERVQRTVRTASILQVRQPVHAGSVGRWRRYAEVLEPLRARLEEAGLV